MFMGYRFAMGSTFEIDNKKKLMCLKNIQI